MGSWGGLRDKHVDREVHWLPEASDLGSKSDHGGPSHASVPQSDWYLSDHKSCLRVWRIRLPPYITDPRSMNFDTVLSRCNSFL